VFSLDTERKTCFL